LRYETVFKNIFMKPVASAALVFAFCAAAKADPPTTLIDIETGNVWNPRNVVRSPGDTGTRFELNRLTGQGPFLQTRFQLIRQVADDKEARLLIAPLSFSGNGTLDKSVDFAGKTFAAGDTVDARYAFHSYRFTLRRRVLQTERTNAWAGWTVKVRDAGILLRTNTQSASDTNIGLVPLLHAAANHSLSDRWSLGFDIDALGAPMGRAIDAGVRAQYRLPDGTRIGLALRTLEGGADNNRVFTFAWLNYASLAITRPL
jgi:hypothetical protein